MRVAVFFAASLYCVCNEPLSTPPVLSGETFIIFIKNYIWETPSLLCLHGKASQAPQCEQQGCCMEGWAVSGLLVSTPTLNICLLFHVMSNAQVIQWCLWETFVSVFCWVSQSLSCLCQELVCSIIFPGMIQHLAQQPSRLCPCKVSRVIPWVVAVPGRGVWRLITLSMCIYIK